MTKVEFLFHIKNTYDNLNKHQFKELLHNTRLKLLDFSSALTNSTSKEEVVYSKLIIGIWISVEKSKRITFKQFKALSSYSKTNWLKHPEEEYKQF